MPPGPPWSPPGIGAAFFSGISQIMASVVSIKALIEAAFCRAERVTLVGSMTPAFTRSSYSAGGGVVAEVGFLACADLLDDDGAFPAAVADDLANRLLAGAADDVDADLLVAFQLELLESRSRAQQSHAAARDDAFLDRRASGMQSILHASLLLLHFGLGGRADLDHRHAAGQLRQPLLQLLAIVVRGGFVDLRAQLLDAALDVLRPCPRRR